MVQSKRGLIALTVLAYLLFVLLKLSASQFDISRFVTAGDHFFNESALDYPIHVIKNSDGYDGQFYYRMALDPATHQRVQHGITFDHPEVRAQRILYPATAWALSLGNGALVPYALVLVNLVSLAGIAWIAMLLAERFGLPPQFGLLLPFYPGFVLSLARDTAEIYASLFALCAVHAALHRKHALAALLAVAAVLTREMTLLYLAGFGIAMLCTAFRTRRLDPAILLYLAVPAALVLWHLALLAQWGTLPLSKLSSDDFVLPPLIDFLRTAAIDVREIASPEHILRHAYYMISLIAVPAFVVLVLRHGVARSAAEPGLKYAWGLYFGLLTVFSIAIWREPYGYIRILCDAYLLGCLVLMSGGYRATLRKLAPFTGVLWVLTCAYTL